MNLISVRICNYRSIKDITIGTYGQTDESHTYGLIGVNEAGKSSILKAIALKDGAVPIALKDFRDRKENVEVIFSYELQEEEVQISTDFFLSSLPDLDLKLNFSELTISYSFGSDSKLTISAMPGKGKSKETPPKLAAAKYPLNIHKAIFWTAEEKYLISKPIELAPFASNPAAISVPLRNCFLLADIRDEAIPERISRIMGNSPEKEQLEDELSESVTRHIKTVWPNHPIKITFSIDAGFINFHVKDLDVTAIAKTADQRSDGFRQFISFLLTISAQNINEELTHTILLLDEPETHLHPQAQIELLNELKAITTNKRNNFAFFATHSNYMIDKSNLSRNYRVEKVKDKTQMDRLDNHNSTYASVNYEVFDIPTSDYYNELYGKLHTIYIEKDAKDKERGYITNFDTNFFHSEKGLEKNKNWKEKKNQATLPTFIRNCINHPEGENEFNDTDLKKSIDLLKKYLDEELTQTPS